MMAHEVFISYSNEDKRIAEGLSIYLEQHGIRCFVAYRDITSSVVWGAAIARAIENCKVALVVLSDSYSRSTQADREVELCAEADKPILLFKIQKTTPKGVKRNHLKGHPYVDAYPNPEARLEKMLVGVRRLFTNLQRVGQKATQAQQNVVPSLTKVVKRRALAEQQAATAEAQRLAMVVEKNRIVAEKTASEAERFRNQTATVAATKAFTDAAPYLVIDLSGGVDATTYPVRYLATPPDLSSDACRTIEMWFRLIPAGSFIMGSPENEIGHKEDETQHPVTLTKPLYMGIFEITQKQYGLIMGTNPSSYKGDGRPVTNVSYDMIRGKVNGAEWPTHNRVDDTSFFGKLRTKTALTADLPTEAQWEYACRAGTTAPLNSGKDLTTKDKCPNMDEVGRYRHNQHDGKGGYSGSFHTKVGMYAPNAWGLYDMHGNVWEWCLDWHGPFKAIMAIDPKGALPSWFMGTPFGSRTQRGGAFLCRGTGCRSALRIFNFPNIHTCTDLGFRAAILP